MMLGWCMDANDVGYEHTSEREERLHKACKNGVLTAKGMLQCNCWCHTGRPKPVKRIPVKRKRRVVDENPVEANPVPKKRGRPKGSKNKPKPVPV